MLLKLKDGGIERISDDSYHYDGCPTCDYGSQYITEVDITLTKHRIHIEINQMYRYALSVADMMKILLGNVDQIKEMNEQDFIVWLQEQLNELFTDADKYLYDVKCKYEVTDVA